MKTQTERFMDWLILASALYFAVHLIVQVMRG